QEATLVPASREGDPERRIRQGQGRAGPVWPDIPANPFVLRVLHHREDHPGARGQVLRIRGEHREDDRRAAGCACRGESEKTIGAQPDVLAVLKLHYLRWNLFEIKGDTYFQYMGIFDTDFDKYTEDAVALFGATGLNTVFENLEGFPKDWKTNASAFIKFVREHHRPSFLEYGEYPYATAEEIKKAL